LPNLNDGFSLFLFLFLSFPYSFVLLNIPGTEFGWLFLLFPFVIPF
jgi:hypothetical protein